MKVLITGGKGVIGTNLTAKLEKDGHEVHVFDRVRLDYENYHRGDICDYFRLGDVFEEVKPDLVFHLAGMVSRLECEETPELAIRTNVSGTLNVCKFCQKYDSRLIYAGSSEEYGTAFDRGELVTEETPFGNPTSFYSMTKRMSDEVIQYLANFNNLKAITMRLFMLYGPGEYPSKYRSAVIRFMDAALRGEDLIVHAGTERSWCYILDAVDAMSLLAEREMKTKYEVFNIGRNDPIPTPELAKKIVELTGSHSNIVTVDPIKTIIPVKRASFEKIKRDVGWEAKTDIDTGLKETLTWLQSSKSEVSEQWMSFD